MADRYWVGGTGTWNTTSTSVWSASSGGPSGASVPTASDNVFFDSATTYTVTMTGALTCLDITVSAGTVTFATGTTPTLAVSGSMSLSTGTVWNSTGTVTFNATTTGKTITTNSTSLSCSVTFNGVGGEWTFQDNFTIGTTNTVTLTNGTIKLEANTLKCGLFSSSNSNTRELNFGTGKVEISGASGTLWTTASEANLTLSGSKTIDYVGTASGTPVFSFGNASTTNPPNLTAKTSGANYAIDVRNRVNNLDFSQGTGRNVGTTSGITVYGNLLLSSSNTGTVTILSLTFAGSGTNTITANGRTISIGVGQSFAINGTGSWTLQDALTVAGNGFILLNQGTFNANGYNVTAITFSSANSNTRALTMGSGTWTISGSGTAWDTSTTTNLTFTSTGNTLTLTSNSAKTLASGGVTFNNVVQGGTGTLTITGSATINTFSNTANGDITLSGAITVTVTTFSVAGLSGRYIYLTGSGASTNLSVASGTTTLSYLAVQNLQFIGGATWVSSILNFCFDGGGTNLTFEAARYWIGAAGNTWDGVTTSYWASTIGGATSGGVPTSTDNVVMPQSGTLSSAISGTSVCKSLVLAARGTASVTVAGGSGGVTIHGSFATGSAGVTFGANQTYTFASTATGNTVTTNGLTTNVNYTFNGVGGAWTLGSALTTNVAITLTNGSFNTGGYALTAGSLSSSNSNTRSISLGASTVTLAGTGGWSAATATGLTVTGNGTISLTSASAKSFQGGGIKTYPTINQGGTGALTISGNNKFTNITNTAIGSVLFTGGTTNEFNSFNLNGTVGNLLTLGSTNTTQATLEKSGNWNVGANSVDAGNNTGLTFAAGGGIDYLSISYINGTVASAVGAFLMFM